MRSVETRVERLEQRTAPEGAVVPCDLTDDPPQEERDRRLAAAHSAAGVGGMVIVIAYEDQEVPGVDQEIKLKWPEQVGGYDEDEDDQE